MRHRIVPVLGVLLGALIGDGRFHAAEVVVEGESLVAGARVQGGSVSAQRTAAFGRGWSGNAQLLWVAQGPQSSLQVSLVAPAEGEYAIAAFFTRAPDYGIVGVAVNDVHLAAFDGFAQRVARSDRVALGRVRLVRGANPMILHIQGKHPQSRGYSVGLDAVLLEAVAAKPSRTDQPAGTVKPPRADQPTATTKPPRADQPAGTVKPPRITQPAGGVRTPSVTRREPPTTPQRTGHVPCAISQVPRPRESERLAVSQALATLDREFSRRPGSDALRRELPFAELRSLTAASHAQMPTSSKRRLGELLTTLNAMSLHPNGAAARDASLANFQARLRELVDIAVIKDTVYAPTYANDLAATEIYGTIDDWKPAKWVLRLHIVACANADGGNKSTMTKAQVQQAVELAAKIFEPAQLRFVFDPAKDWEEAQNTKLNQWDDATASAWAAKPSLQGKIVLFSAWGPNAKPNDWAANGGTHIWLGSGGSDAAGICHEVGHFLGRLFHTFPGDGNQLIYGDLSKVTAANVDGVIADFIYDSSRNKSGFTDEQAMDGDGFSDTPPDPGNDYWEKKFGPGTCCSPAYPTATVPNPKGGPAWVFTPDRANLMSYFFRCPTVPTITAQQTVTILGRLEGTTPQGDNRDLRRLIEGRTAFASSSGRLILVGKVRNVGTSTSSGGRTAVLESVGEGQTPNTPLGSPVPIGPLAPGDWVLVKVPMPSGTAWKGKACLRISAGDENPANDSLCPEPYKAPVVK